MASVNVHRVLITVRQLGAKKATRQLAGVTLALGLMGFAAIKVVKGLIAAGDEITRLKNKTAVFAHTQQSANDRLAAVVDISRKTNSSLKSVGDVMQRVALAGTGLGLTDQTITQITSNLAMAVKLSGATAQEAEGALRQFSQGLAANRLSGQELNSVLEQTPLIAKLLADSLNKSTGALRQMGKDGELTSKVLIKAFGSTIPDLERMFKKFVPPVEDLFVSVRREITMLMAKMGEITGFTVAFRSGLDWLVKGLIAFNDRLRDSPEFVDKVMTALKTAAGALAGFTAGLVAVGLALVGATGGMSLLIPLLITASAGVGALLGFTDQSTTQQLKSLNEELTRNIEQVTRSTTEGSKSRELAMNKATEGILSQISAVTTLLNLQSQSAGNQADSDQGLDDVQKMKAAATARTEALKILESTAKGWKDVWHNVDEAADRLNDYTEGMLAMDAAGQLFDFTGGEQGASPDVRSSVMAALGEALNEVTKAQEELAEANQDTRDTFQDLLTSLDPIAKAHEAYASGMAAVRAAINLAGEATEEHIHVQKMLMDQLEESNFGDHKEMLLDTREAYDDLTASIFPLIELEQSMAEGVTILDEALMLQLITLEEYNLSMDRLRENFSLAFGEAQLENLTGFEGALAGMTVGVQRFATEWGGVNEAIANITTNSINMMTDAFADFFSSGKMDIKAFGQAWLKMIIQIITKLLVALAIQAAINAMGGGGGSAVSSMGLGGIGSGFTSQALTGAGGAMSRQAAGGHVQGGEPVIVGERGPEMFVPPTSGSIQSNTSMAMKQAPAPQITIVNVDDPDSVIDAMGTHEGEQQILNIISRNPDVLRSLV